MATLDQSWGTNNDVFALGYTGQEYVAQQVVIGAMGTLDNVELNLKKAGSPTGNITVRIYSDSGDSPNVAISDGITYNAASLTTSLAYIPFVFGTKPTVTVGMKVWIVAFFDGDNTNYVQWACQAGYAGVDAKYGSNGTVWSAGGAGDCNFKEYYNPPAIGGSFLFNMI